MLQPGIRSPHLSTFGMTSLLCHGLVMGRHCPTKGGAAPTACQCRHLTPDDGLGPTCPSPARGTAALRRDMPHRAVLLALETTVAALAGGRSDGPEILLGLGDQLVEGRGHGDLAPDHA